MNNNTADGMAEIGKQMEVFAQKSIAESAFRALLATGMSADAITDWVKGVLTKATAKAEKAGSDNTASDISEERAELLRRVQVLAKDINKFQATAGKKNDKKPAKKRAPIPAHNKKRVFIHSGIKPFVGRKRKVSALESSDDDWFDSEFE